MRTCLAWSVVSARVKSLFDAKWPRNERWPSPTLAKSVAATIASGQIRPSRLLSLLGHGQGFFSEDGARAVQQPNPQQKPVSVPQQHVLFCAATAALVPSTQTINWGNNPAGVRLMNRLIVTEYRDVRHMKRIMSMIPYADLRYHLWLRWRLFLGRDHLIREPILIGCGRF